MREPCLSCMMKHISKAIILLSEAKLGYPLHFWLALGNLSEAEDEIVAEYPEFARKIRELRMNLEIGIATYGDVMNILEEAAKLKNGEEDE